MTSSSRRFEASIRPETVASARTYIGTRPVELRDAFGLVRAGDDLDPRGDPVDDERREHGRGVVVDREDDAPCVGDAGLLDRLSVGDVADDVHAGFLLPVDNYRRHFGGDQRVRGGRSDLAVSDDDGSAPVSSDLREGELFQALDLGLSTGDQENGVFVDDFVGRRRRHEFAAEPRADDVDARFLADARVRDRLPFDLGPPLDE
jgi:hypothetical protein